MGNLETKASTDVYQFTIGAGGQRTLLDLVYFPYGNNGYALNYKIVKSDGTVALTGKASDVNQRRVETNLAEGQYELIITPEAEASVNTA